MYHHHPEKLRSWHQASEFFSEKSSCEVKLDYMLLLIFLPSVDLLIHILVVSLANGALKERLTLLDLHILV